MKKICIIIAILLLLTGCGSAPAMETISDQLLQPVTATLQQVVADFPRDASVEVLQNTEYGKLYLCDGYTISVQTMASGDLKKTLKTLTGCDEDALTVIKTRQDECKRYECVWTASGEGEMQVGRACILDDGAYHYAITVMAGESLAGELTQTWESLFDSFRLIGADVDLNTGS